MQIFEYHRDNFRISTDKSLLDIDVVHGYLTHSYWTPGIPKESVSTGIQHSLCFGVYDQDRQIGFARVITDYTLFAYLCDLFIIKSYQGQGLGSWLVESIVNCQAFEGIRGFTLATRDAHGLYEKFGFERITEPEKQMKLSYEMPWYRPELVEE